MDRFARCLGSQTTGAGYNIEQLAKEAKRSWNFHTIAGGYDVDGLTNAEEKVAAMVIKIIVVVVMVQSRKQTWRCRFRKPYLQC